MGKLDRRRREILELVASNSFMTIDTLADHFSVTPPVSYTHLTLPTNREV